MMMSRSRMRRRRRGERSNASHYKVLPPYQALQETPSTIRETLCTRKYTVCNSHRDVLCSHSMTSAVHGNLEWAVEERVRLCSEFGIADCHPSSRETSWQECLHCNLSQETKVGTWELGGMHYAIRRPFPFLLELSFSEELTVIPGSQRPLGFFQNQIIVAGLLWLKIFVSWTMDIHWYHLNIRRYGVKLWKWWWWWWRWDQ